MPSTTTQSGNTSPQIDGIYYELGENGSAIVTCKASCGSTYESAEYSGRLVIPEKVVYEDKEYVVQWIAAGAFYGCSLEALTIPQTVLHVSDAMGGEINELYISSWTWWNELNQGYDNLVNITEIWSLLDRPKKLFVGGKECDLVNFTLPAELVNVRDFAFAGINKMQTLTVPAGVTTLGYACFYMCKNLQEVVIGNDVVSIGNYAFGECSQLTTMTLGSSLKDIAYGSAFSGAHYEPKITKLILPDLKMWCELEGKGQLMTSHDVRLYSDPETEITELVVPEGVKTITSSSFYNSSIQSVSFPASLETIQSGAFCGCKGLTSLTIPDNVKMIGGSAFYGCDKITTVVIGDGVETILNEAFGDNSSLETVTLGKSVSKIYSKAFSSSRQGYQGSLLKVIARNATPGDIYEDAFTDNTYRNGTLYVPAGTMNRYVRFNGWRNFLDIVEESSDEPCTLTIADAAHGATQMELASGVMLKMTLLPTDGWMLHSVSFNGEDMTAAVAADGRFTTPVITGEATLNIVYEQIVESAVRTMPAAGSLRLTAMSGGVHIAGAEPGSLCRIYGTDGRMVRQVTLIGDADDVALSGNQTYVVTVGGKTLKLVVR